VPLLAVPGEFTFRFSWEVGDEEGRPFIGRAYLGLASNNGNLGLNRCLLGLGGVRENIYLEMEKRNGKRKWYILVVPQEAPGKAITDIKGGLVGWF